MSSRQQLLISQPSAKQLWYKNLQKPVQKNDKSDQSFNQDTMVYPTKTPLQSKKQQQATDNFLRMACFI